MKNLIDSLLDMNELMEKEQQDRKQLIAEKMKIKVSDVKLEDGTKIDRLIYNHSIKRSELVKLFRVSNHTLKSKLKEAIEAGDIEPPFMQGITHHYNRFSVAKMMELWGYKKYSEEHVPLCISIQNHKGGTGKTSSCVSLAVRTALDLHLNANVLVLDLDPQGSAGQNLIYKYEEDAECFTIVDAALHAVEKNSLFAEYLASGNSMEHMILSMPFTTHLPNLDVIPAFAEDERYIDDFWEQDEKGRERLLSFLAKTVIPTLKKRYDFIFIDTPPQNSPILWSVNEAADAIVIPVTPHEYDFVSTTNYLKALAHTLSKLPSKGENVKWLKLLPANYNHRSNEEADVFHKIVRTSHGNLLTSPIFHSEAFLAAAANYRTIFDFKKSEDMCSAKSLDDAQNSVNATYIQFLSEMKRIAKMEVNND